MPLREDILAPIAGDNPGGRDIRRTPVYDKIVEARREDDALAQGIWQHERKVADYQQVARLAQEAIATESKDLQLAAWLTEALLKTEGFSGLRDGLTLCHGLINRFWDNLYPEPEDGDMELRASRLEWLATRLGVPLGNVALCRDGHGLFAYKASRSVVYEDAAKTKEQKAARDAALKEGKLAPELFDKSFAETPKAFYAQAEKDLDSSLAALKLLDEAAAGKFADMAPSFTKLKGGIEEVRHTVHAFLQKKRETDPDPVVAPAVEEAAAAEATVAAAGEGAAETSAGGGFAFTAQAAAEPADRRDAIAAVAGAAQFLRRREPLSPAPYMMLRGLRWGELRASSDPATLEAPPTEVRQHIKSLALAGRWKDLLEAAEAAMALPCGRAWLDLQRLVVEACVALGTEYDAIAIAIRSGLRSLLQDMPALLEATLTDDTPAANAQTQTWLRDLLAEPAAPAASASRVPNLDDPAEPGWQKKFIDPHTLAREALRQGQAQRALEILQRDIERQRSGRGRFQRKLQLAQLCIAAGKDAIAQPMLDDIAAAVENHKLEEWEGHETVAGVLVLLLQSSKKVQGDAKLKQALYERICRLDPVQALAI